MNLDQLSLLANKCFKWFVHQGRDKIRRLLSKQGKKKKINYTLTWESKQTSAIPPCKTHGQYIGWFQLVLLFPFPGRHFVNRPYFFLISPRIPLTLYTSCGIPFVARIYGHGSPHLNQIGLNCAVVQRVHFSLVTTFVRNIRSYRLFRTSYHCSWCWRKGSLAPEINLD